jgi:hypothetical protein
MAALAAVCPLKFGRKVVVVVDVVDVVGVI